MSLDEYIKQLLGAEGKGKDIHMELEPAFQFFLPLPIGEEEHA